MRSVALHRAIRVALLVVIAGALGLGAHRIRRSEEQVELTRYVERELPPLVAEEQAVADALSALLADRALPPDAARRRLVDELTPRLVRLRRRAAALSPETATVRQLAAQYLGVVDAWTEAARAAVHAIDDPKTSTEAGVALVRDALADAARASQAFSAHLVETCAHHRLAAPRAGAEPPR